MTQRTIMAVGAHADDVELHVGGTLAKYHARGYRIVYVMATNNMSGSWSRLQADGTITTVTPSWREIMPQRLKETRAAAEALGTEPICLNHPQRHFTREDGTVCEVRFGCERPEFIPPEAPTIMTACHHAPSIQAVADLIAEHQPEAILTHGMPMVNPEHFGTCVLVTHAYNRAVSDGHQGMLLQWQDLGIHAFGASYNHWDTFVDISDFWPKKLELCALHACQKPDPARLDWPAWGPACGCEHAEVFRIIGATGGAQRQPGDFTLEITQHAGPRYRAQPNRLGGAAFSNGGGLRVTEKHGERLPANAGLPELVSAPR